ncbi:protein mono-ADP-ribosyltransferase PARP14-like isoform X2 [Ptychodera flava]
MPLDVIKKYEDKRKILDCAETYDIEVEECMKGTGACLKIRGLVHDVMDAGAQIRGIIQNIKIDIENEKKMKTLAQNVVWKFEDTDGQYDVYDEHITGLIEIAYQGDKQPVDFVINEQRFRIDFGQMTEMNLDDPDASIAKVRRELKAGGIPLPENWVKMADKEQVKRVLLGSNSDEYSKVEKRMQESYKPNSIVQIERIQNPKLYRQYFVERQTMVAKNKPEIQNERKLFHGTAEDSIEKINKNGFNRSFAGKHAAYYGNGTYFAVNAKYSASGTYSSTDSKGNKHMYLAMVLTGEFAVGKSGFLVPPAKGSDPTDCYDSVVDNETNPSMFVVFNDAMAYPEYLITFTQ